MNFELAKKHLLVQSALTFVLLSCLQLSTWLPLRFWSAWGGGNYLDTWQILRYAKCYEEVGLSVYENSGTTCSSYLYGRTLLQALSFFGLNTSATQIIGYTFLAILAVGLSLVFPVQNKRDFVTFMLVACSPPVMLLADRGNFDIVIFFALILVAKFTALKRFYSAYILLTVTVLMKFYTVPVFLLIILLSRLPREKIFGAMLLLISTGFSLRDIAITQTNYPSGSDAQFGFTVWGEYLNKYSSTQVNIYEKYFISMIVFTVIILLTYFIIRTGSHTPISIVQTYTWQFIGFWIFLIVSVSCYFAGMNFDYRLIFFAATILLASKLLVGVQPHTQTSYLIVMLWLTYPSGGLQPIGDLAIEVAIACTAIILVLEVKRNFKKYLRLNRLQWFSIIPKSKDLV